MIDANVLTNYDKGIVPLATRHRGTLMAHLPVLGSRRRGPSVVVIVLRLLILTLPALLLYGGTLVSSGQMRQLLWLGTLMEVLFGFLLLFMPNIWRPARGAPIIALYLTGLVWVWICTAQRQEWYPHFAQAILLIVPLGLFAVQQLADTGAALRHANELARRLAERTEWPSAASDYRGLPEVKALREATHADPAAALALLEHPRPEVRLAALAAIEFRKVWEPEHASAILRVVTNATEAEVRAAAIHTLGNVEERPILEVLIGGLTDPARSVRAAAADALLWDAEQRWKWLRLHIHAALAHPNGNEDEALICAGGTFPEVMVKDLVEWAKEPGIVGVRATLTLAAHYRKVLQGGPAPLELLAELRAAVTDVRAPVIARIEFARVLLDAQLYDRRSLEQLLDPTHPTTLRLMAAEVLLQDRDHPQALAQLRELARQANREVALNAARIVQLCLGLDMGLTLSEPPPPLQSRQAAEAARRAFAWATQPLPESAANTGASVGTGSGVMTGSGSIRNPASGFRKRSKSGSGTVRW
jgi:HEAT repeat protein